MNEPSRPTIKKLFAFSSNRCAFPKCSTPVIYPGTDSVVCEVCHIKGEKPTAARHDGSQSDEDRHGFDNLILLCNVHHKVVDDDEDAYTVERLRKMKADHEAKAQPPSDDDGQAERVAVLIQNNTVTGGSIIQTRHQSGGQTAHSIYNYHQAPREIGQAFAEAVISHLRPFGAEQFRVTSLSPDGATMALARRLDSLLQLAGWHSLQDISLLMTPETPEGDIVLAVPANKPSYEALLRLLRQAGLDARSAIHADLPALDIRVASK